MKKIIKLRNTKEGSEYPDPWRKLASAIVLQAVKEAQACDNVISQLDAVLWLAGSEAAFYTEALDLVLEPLTLLTSGALKRKKICQKEK